MRKYLGILSTLLALSTPLTAQEEGVLPLGEATCEPSSLVGGCVNVITGTFNSSIAPLALTGPDPFHPRCTFTSAADIDSVRPWIFNTGGLADLWQTEKHFYLEAREESGCTPRLIGKKAKKGFVSCHRKMKSQEFSIDLENLNVGVTNCGGGDISGMTNIKNLQARYDKGTKYLTVYTGGHKREFKFYTESTKDLSPLRLFRETLPSGNKILYNYYDTGQEAVYMNQAETKVLGSYRIHYKKKYADYSSSEGKNCRLDFHHFKNYDDNGTHRRKQICKVTTQDSPTVDYNYYGGEDKKYSYELLTKKSFPDNRYLQVEYYFYDKYGMDEYLINLKDGYTGYFRKVRELKAPVGIDESPISIFRFYYHEISSSESSRKGLTEVRDAFNHKTIYHYSPEERLTAIEHYNGRSPEEHTLYSLERFYWGAKKSKNYTDLIGKSLEDADGHLITYRHLSYDNRYNVTEDRLYGNLTGLSTIHPEVDEKGNPIENGAESYAVKRSYSGDYLDLLVKEEYPNGKKVEFSYKPGTNLLTEKIQSDGTRIYSRSFHTYNDDAVLIKTVSDDGSATLEDDLEDVTLRLITKVTPKEEGSYIGLPLEVSYYYLDLSSGNELLLKREVNYYNENGRLIQKDHYDSNNLFQFSLKWELDSMGRVIREEDALGRISEYKYDANCNRIYEKGPENFHTEKKYDYMNRLVSSTEIHPDGIHLSKHWCYDYMGNVTCENDPFGNETRFVYNDQNRLIETHFPPVEIENGQIAHPVVKQEYDQLGNCTKIIDEQGGVTLKRYTLYGKPIEVIYPDDSKETYTYNLDGSLATEIAKNGTETRYHYDAEMRVTRKELYGADGTYIGSKRYTYQGPHLVEEEDLNGNRIFYRYDYAGRQVEVEKNGVITQFFYDSFGRKERTVETYEENKQRITLLAYDLLGRVVSEKIEENDGTLLTHLSYTYDTAGNKTSKTIHHAEKDSTTHYFYNTRGKLTRTEDPCGSVTQTSYNYSHLNSLSQRVLQITTTDALGSQTKVTHDCRGQVVETSRFNPLGQTLSSFRLVRDLHGNMVERIEDVYLNGAIDRVNTTTWMYDVMHRLVGLTEAVGTSEQKTTCYSYNTKGQKEAVVHPQGLLELFEYDFQGRLSRYHASDASFDYHYTYDSNSNLLCAEDRISNTCTVRTYDAFDRVISEEQANGLKLEYTYDPLGRLRSYILPDLSQVQYQYDAGHLRSIQRVKADGSLNYEHTCDSYDGLGHLTQETYPIGKINAHYTYDDLGRKRSSKTSSFSEEIPNGGYDSVGNLIESKFKDSQGEVSNKYVYDPLYQLTEESGHRPHRYTNDSIYNQRSKDDHPYHVNSLNQLSQTDTASYSYDAQGNRSTKEESDSEIRYAYDALGRLISVEGEKWREEYTYDAFNRRMSRVRYTPGWIQQESVQEAELYFYCSNNEVGTTDTKGKVSQFRVLGAGKGAEIGAAITHELNGYTYGVTHDHNGHVTSLFDLKSGKAIETYRYTAFGEETIYDSWGFEVKHSSLGNRWRFSSKRKDEHTGLINFGRRYYDPVVARWLTPDPLGYEAGPNLYAYVNNAPLTHIDLYGLIGISERRHARARVDYSQKYTYHARAKYDRRNTSPSYNGRTFPAIDRNQVKAGVCFFGKGIECTGRHLMIYPVRPLFVVAGRFLQGKTKPDKTWPEAPCLCFTVGEQNVYSKQAFVYLNGMETSIYKAEEGGEFISENLRNTKVYVGYNSTAGIKYDLFECILNFFGIRTPSVDSALRSIRMAIRDVGGVGNGGRILLEAHSQGTLNLACVKKYLTKEERMMIHVVTFGAARFAKSEDWGSAINIVGDNDYICYLDPISLYHAKTGKSDNCVLLKGKDAGHSFLGGAYEEYNKLYLRLFDQKNYKG